MVGVRLDPADVEELDRVAADRGVDRSVIVRERLTAPAAGGGQRVVAGGRAPRVVTERPAPPGSPPPGGGHVTIKADGMGYLTRRAAVLGCTVDEVVRAALAGYAEEHPLRVETGHRPAPKAKEKR